MNASKLVLSDGNPFKVLSIDNRQDELSIYVQCTPVGRLSARIAASLQQKILATIPGSWLIFPYSAKPPELEKYFMGKACYSNKRN